MKVSILIPAYNAAPFIEDTLASCLNQGSSILEEIIIIDDGSTDTTQVKVKTFAAANPEVSIQLKSNTKKGACAARNLAFSLATGEAVQWLDADDILGPGKLNAQLELLAKCPNHLVATKWRRFTNDLTQLYPEEGGAWTDVPRYSAPIEWLRANRMMIPAGWLGTRSLFKRTGQWDESLLINQDGEYFTRAIANCDGVIYEPNCRVYYRSGNSSSVSHFEAHKAPSLYSSCESYERTLLALSEKAEVGTLISNMYMGFIYRVYPLTPELRAAARRKIGQYGRPTRPNDLANSTTAKLICAMFGWKSLVLLRLLRTKLRR